MSTELLANHHHAAAAPTTRIVSWQTIGATVGLVVVVLLLAYFLHRFVCATNKKLKAVEQAIHTLNERSKQQQQQPLPAPLFTRHESFVPPPMAPPMAPPVAPPMAPPVAPPMAPPVAPPVVIDTKTLDKELTEELKELSAEVQEGRVDAAAAVETKV